LKANASTIVNTNDPWYQRQANRYRTVNTPFYTTTPTPAYLNGKTPTGYSKRDFLSPEDIIVDEGNSSRRATDEELKDDFGFVRCEGNCQGEMQDLGFASLPVLPGAHEAPQTMEPCTTPAGTVTVTVTADPIDDVSSPTSTTFANTASRVLSAAQSMITEAAEYAFNDGADYEDYEDDEDDY
jgi:chitinase